MEQDLKSQRKTSITPRAKLSAKLPFWLSPLICEEWREDIELAREYEIANGCTGIELFLFTAREVAPLLQYRTSQLWQIITPNFPESCAHLETAFIADYAQNSIKHIRVVLVIAILVYGGFGILDIFCIPAATAYSWLIRYAVVCPMAVVVFIASFFPVFFSQFMQLMLSIMMLFAGLGIVVMIALAGEDELGFDTYYSGVMMVSMGTFTLMRLRFVYATIVAWLTLVGYEFTAVFYQQLYVTGESLTMLINNNFFLIGANILGMVTCFYLERYARRDFLARYLMRNDKPEYLKLFFS
ncbi:hypothetical protein Pse7367_3751 (plasmid) [Thalassoporum mexicanum PCC 7367]|uniref:hypothetical protein n=1 Tax=Thalassoporum mexicanum TaxID=3457544 RepID=UPI00029FAAA0|nr:hypothetical protein [Pseudanabaena sp. PCC 7367]AFY71977.1 hypothetical protein Pse7367_3751 [Pseudanabaena sp. PCC 7367]